MPPVIAVNGQAIQAENHFFFSGFLLIQAVSCQEILLRKLPCQHLLFHFLQLFAEFFIFLKLSCLLPLQTIRLFFIKLCLRLQGRLKGFRGRRGKLPLSHKHRSIQHRIDFFRLIPPEFLRRFSADQGGKDLAIG
ncbi:hypothetical protein SDC9_210671 [bioreactor metagenome]|uniref:Uncharacterized protein n=1 Tax=bioreactor metagenome TaxID=1076179 RepID=A0A645JGU0_9ZZZZ